MGLPTKKRTSRSKKERASHFALKKVQVVYDEEGNPQLPHHANPTTGKYKGRNVVDVAKRIARRARKMKPIS